MAFRISRLRVVTVADAGFSDLVAALPDGADNCVCCGWPARDSVAMVLTADESDDNPLAFYSVVCPTCALAQPPDQVLTEWTEELVEQYGGLDIPNLHRAGR
jgi:hypothetical protein